MRRSLWALFGVMLLVLAGCAGVKADPAREAQADQLLRQISASDLTGINATLSPEVSRDQVRASLPLMRQYLHAGPIPKGRSISWSAMTDGEAQHYRLLRIYEYPAGDAVLTETAMVRVGQGPWLVFGVNVNRATAAQLSANDFTLKGRSPAHFAVLATAIAVPLFILFTVGVALWRRRWGWALLSILGVAALQFNWTTGGWSVQPIYLTLLGATFMKMGSPFAPWILTVGVPLPAVLFWILRKNRPKPPKAVKARAGATPADNGDWDRPST